MSSFWWGQSAFDEQVEKATSELLPAGQVDLALHLEISDQIRSKKVNAKEAMRSLKQRLSHKNPNVILATLSLVDTCMKNSGSAFVKEVATREFMEEMTHLLKLPTGCNQDVKERVLYLIQVWGIASKGNNSLSYITGTYSLLRAEGYIFPPVTERIDSILLETAVAPEWTDSDVCERCRTSFTLTNRKHHCRQCGQTFCQQCSSKSIPLPHLGVNDIVRVCDGCYIKVKLAKVADKDSVPYLLGTSSSISSSLTPAYAPSIKNNNNTATATTTIHQQQREEDQFENDLKKAMEMSLKETQQHQQKKTMPFKEADVNKVKSAEEEEEEAQIAAAISASLQDMKVSEERHSYYGNYYNSTTAGTAAGTAAGTGVLLKQNHNGLSSTDMENIQLFSTLMQRVKAAGGDISGDTQINTLYTQIGALQPKLVKTLDETVRKHETFVNLHAKLNKAVKSYEKILEDRFSSYSTAAVNNNNSYNHQYIPSPSPYQINTSNAVPQQQYQQQQLTGYSSYPQPSYTATQPAPQQPISYSSAPVIQQQQSQPIQYPSATPTQYPSAVPTQYPSTAPIQYSGHYPSYNVATTNPSASASTTNDTSTSHYYGQYNNTTTVSSPSHHLNDTPSQQTYTTNNRHEAAVVAEEAPLIDL